ncbi:MAG: phosphoribosylanthranilate isomerase [Chloroflexi bacterium]|nr:MAG: phosphoribosylanthranilate isomerase [Chloroflexota bacterium]
MSDVRVKICGITNLEDACIALQAGADYLGFNLYPKSPRYIAPDIIKQMILDIGDWVLQRDAPIPSPQSPIPNTPRFVGIFVNETVERISDILTFTGLDYAQLHGDEPPGSLQRLTGKAFKAVRPADAADASEAATRFAPLGLDDGPQLLIDAYDPAEYGGTGKKADWNSAAVLAQRYPRLMLAGGLTPANVAQAIRAVRPWAVDVSSGVETSPGRKDHDALRAFLRAARA